jgi:hypothetical protein
VAEGGADGCDDIGEVLVDANAQSASIVTEDCDHERLYDKVVGAFRCAEEKWDDIID